MPILLLLLGFFCYHSSIVEAYEQKQVPRPIPIPIPIPIPTPQPPKKIILPHPRYSTLQSAVDAVANGGEILLNPGIYTGAVCNNKKIHIVGNQGRSDVIINGRIEVGQSGDATLKNFTINSQGSWAIIKKNNQTSLAISNLRLNNGGVSALGNAHIEKLEINNPETGLALYQFQKLTLKTIDVKNATGFGIWAHGFNNCQVELALVGVKKSARQAIVLKGENCNGSAQFMRIEDSKLAGIQVENFNLLNINSSTVLRTLPGSINGSLPVKVPDERPRFGDAVITIWSNVVLLGNNLNSNGRTGATIIGCNDYRAGSLQLGNNNLFANPIDINIETLAPPGRDNANCNGAGKLEDLGGNQCGDGPDRERPCRAQSSTLDPLPV